MTQCTIIPYGIERTLISPPIIISYIKDREITFLIEDIFFREKLSYLSRKLKRIVPLINGNELKAKLGLNYTVWSVDTKVPRNYLAVGDLVTVRMYFLTNIEPIIEEIRINSFF